MARQPVEEQPDVNDRIAAVLEQLAANAPVQDIGYGHPKYQERLREEGFFITLAKKVFQNGREVEPRGLKPETIDHVVLLAPGKYIGGAVTVAHDQKGQIHLIYKSQTPEDRMRFQQVVQNFDDMVAKIWAEMHPAKQ